MRTLLPCGTSAASDRHYLAGETPCGPCKEANRAKFRTWYRKTHGHKERASHKIADYVETHGPIQLNRLIDLIQGRHDIKEATIRRAVWRMVADGRLEVNYDPVSPLTVEVP